MSANFKSVNFSRRIRLFRDRSFFSLYITIAFIFCHSYRQLYSFCCSNFWKADGLTMLYIIQAPTLQRGCYHTILPNFWKKTAWNWEFFGPWGRGGAVPEAPPWNHHCSLKHDKELVQQIKPKTWERINDGTVCTWWQHFFVPPPLHYP